jgi:hypothetical protein
MSFCFNFLTQSPSVPTPSSRAAEDQHAQSTKIVLTSATASGLFSPTQWPALLGKISFSSFLASRKPQLYGAVRCTRAHTSRSESIPVPLSDAVCQGSITFCSENGISKAQDFPPTSSMCGQGLFVGRWFLSVSIPTYLPCSHRSTSPPAFRFSVSLSMP